MSQRPDACPRAMELEPQPLVECVTSGATATSATANFRVLIPDPRIWVKVGVLWVPTDGVTAPGAATLTLWMALTEKGGIGRGGRDFPVEDVFGTSAAPLTIPTNTALFGKFANIRTGNTGVQGILVVTTPSAGVTGRWVAKASYYPTVDMPRDEWEALQGTIAGIAADAKQTLLV